jgi:hypothetical protein
MEGATSRVWDCTWVTRGYGVGVRLVLVHDAGVEAIGVCGRGGSLPLLPLGSSEVNIRHMGVFVIEIIRGEVVGVVWGPWVMVG